MYHRETKALVDRREMLRIKVKSLAEEARIIRREEQRTWGVLREELHHHRVVQVRRAARSAHLAYGLIKGRTLLQMEPISRASGAQDWPAIYKMVVRYGGYDLALVKDERARAELQHVRDTAPPRTPRVAVPVTATI